MKLFAQAFIVCFVLSIIFIFFFGGLIFNNIWLILAISSLILAALITLYANQDSRIDRLEKTVEQLKNEKN